MRPYGQGLLVDQKTGTIDYGKSIRRLLQHNNNPAATNRNQDKQITSSHTCIGSYDNNIDNYTGIIY